MSETPKIVFDTQIFLRALINRRSICGKLVFDMQADYVMYVTDTIKQEIINVLKRPVVRNKFPQITAKQVSFVQTIIDLAPSVDIKPEDIEPISRDPKDDIFLACAKAANADYLVSEDQDLLVLKEYGGAKIVDAITFFNILKNDPEDESS